MDIDLSQLTEEELLDLNRRVVDRIRFLREARCRERMSELAVGDRVSFHPECGHEIVGTVIRLNRKSVTVMSDDGHSWRVAPSFLTRAPAEGQLAGALASLAARRGRGEA